MANGTELNCDDADINYLIARLVEGNLIADQ
jgi:hypothetical protein